MPSTYSSLKIELPATGEQSGTWGNTTNTNLGTALEEAIVGSADVTFASGNVTLTLTNTNASQVARNLRLNLVGTTGGSTRTLTVPAIEKLYLVSNNCADSVIVGNATGSTVTVPAGTNMLVYNDGTDILNGITYFTGLTIGSLTLTTALTIANGGTGLSSFTIGDLPYYATGTALSKLAIGTNGYILKSTGSAPSWVDPTTVVGGAGGSNTQIQYNSSGALAGLSTFTTDGTNVTLTKQLNLTNASDYNLYASGSGANYMAGNLGLGSTTIGSGINVNLGYNITGGTTSQAFRVSSVIQSDVTNTANIFNTAVTTATASFTLGTLNHFNANQGTLGVGSAVTTQIGFRAGASLTGATNNRGFQGDIASATNAWNLYMTGTAANYLAGQLTIGTTASSATAQVYLGGTSPSSGANSYYVFADVTNPSTTTGVINVFRASLKTQAASFTVGTGIVFNISGSSIGSGSTVTSARAINIESGFKQTGTTNTYGIYADLASASNTYNLYMNGTADNYLAGNLGIGNTNLTGYNLRIANAITGNTTSQAVFANGTIQSDVTSNAFYFRTTSNTQATTFTAANIYHYGAEQGTIGVGSTVNNQVGYSAQSTLTGATNNFGFYGSLAAATGRYNLYMVGTANNYLAGSLGIGTTALTGYNLTINKNITGATSSYGIANSGTVQSDVTTAVYAFTTNIATQATAFTLGALYHYQASQATIGLGSTVTAQYGYLVASNLTGATNNYGFFGNIASGSNRWNLYMNGTADNYLAGNLGIGITNPSSLLHIQGATPTLIIQDTTSAVGGVGGIINFIGYTSGTTGANIEAQIKGIKSSANPSGELRFFTSNSSGTSIERAIIDGSGNVGIGITPTYKLDVLTGQIAGVSTGFRVAASGNGGAGRGNAITIGAGGSASSVDVAQIIGYQETGSATANNASLAFTVANTSGTLTERMRIDSAGNVGIGITPSAWNSPLKAMQVKSVGVASNGASQIFFGNIYRATSYAATYIDSSYGGEIGFNANGVGEWTFTTAPSGTAGAAATLTERMRIDSSGNVLIGGSTANGRLAVQGYSSSDTAKDIAINRSSSATTIQNAPNITFADGTTNNTVTIQAGSGNLQFWNYVSGSWQERMRIDSSGNLLVGTTSTSRTSGAGIKNLISTSPDVVVVGSGTTNSDVAFEAYSTGASAFRFQVGYGGTIYATSTTITGISDQRLKENIIDLDDGLDAVMALKPRKFDWKEGKGKNIKGDRGFIAQEFETVFPDMIEESKDPVPEGEEPYKAVNANIIPTLVKAVQEQQIMIEELKAKIAALEAK